MKKLYAIITCICVSMQVMAQDPSRAVPYSVDSLIIGIKVRQSFQTAGQASNPALFQVTIPQNGRISWLVDAALGITIGKLSQGNFSSKLIGEFHRNTVSDSLQYNYQLGYNFGYQHNLGNSDVDYILTGNLKYIRDIADSGHSIAATLNLSLFRSGKGKFQIGRIAYLSNYAYAYQFNPSLEVQYQQVLTSDKGEPGAIIRPMINLDAAFAINRPNPPKGQVPPKLVELTINYDNRYAAINSVHNGEGYTKLFSPGFVYYIFYKESNNSSTALGVNYNLGSDPLNGLKDQRFWRFSLQFQL